MRVNGDVNGWKDAMKLNDEAPGQNDEYPDN